MNQIPESLKLLNLTDENIKKTGTDAVISFAIPKELPWFSGHFPGQPLLPAVITTEMSDGFIQWLGRQPEMVSQAKFKGPIPPETAIQIDVRMTDKSATVIWRDSSDGSEDNFLADIRFQLT